MDIQKSYFYIYKTSELLIKEDFRKAANNASIMQNFVIDMEGFVPSSNKTGCYNITNINYSEWINSKRDCWNIYQTDERNKIINSEDIKTARAAFYKIASDNNLHFSPPDYASFMKKYITNKRPSSPLEQHKYDELLQHIKTAEIELLDQIVFSDKFLLKKASTIKKDNLSYLRETFNLLVKANTRRNKKTSAAAEPSHSEVFVLNDRIKSEIYHTVRIGVNTRHTGVAEIRATNRTGVIKGQKTAILRQQVTDLLDHGAIETTFTRAKEIAPIAEKMIILGKKKNSAAYHQTLSVITRPEVADKLFDTIAPRYTKRTHDFIRITRNGNHGGQEVVTIELV